MINTRDANFLVISREDREKVLSVKCKKHPDREADIIYLIPDVENQRICTKCVRKNNIP